MIHIRNAHAGEAGILTNIGLRAWQRAMAPIGGTDAHLESARTAFTQFAERSWLTITVIEQNGALAGWAAREELDENITDFWIDPSYTRQGLGSALLSQIEKDIVGQGLEKAALQSHAGNAEAVSFFKAHGYEVHWLSVIYSPRLDRDIPTIGLSKTLVTDDDGTYGIGF
ncbi:GNAT family N-acetyltransferase [Neorhizobium sp. P12A]|uniref:GNAT family N-acetyltransferase n=1 Tax=Rhizobium/Agrobacterium group TaxID=227290 RepID=UPI0010494B4D|nr:MULTISPECIES: GNAT family N-acetyltransferase [Rhizobium/Agrobacterium group]KAA0698414.1 GNAT family N-acetyltransferase [Neorhizobium sp. P12A]TCR92797.1 ribosomal-protein-alanine N-acetyltransferase [Rhizobium sp. BK376]